MKLLVVLSLIFAASSLMAGGKHGHGKKEMAASAKDCTNFDKFGDVTSMEMQKIAKAGAATIIDVNSTSSFQKSHIPGAKHFASIKDTFAKELPKDKNAPIIAYCGSKQCTAWQSAAKMACEMGYKNIRHFSGGIAGWNKIKKS